MKIQIIDLFKSLFVWLLILAYVIIMFPVTVITWFVVYPFDQKRSVIHWCLVYQGVILSRLIPIWQIRLEGREKAQKKNTYVIISNHQSILDILIINCLRYRFRWISKIENYKVPVFGLYMRMAKYIVVDRGNKESKYEMIEKSVESIRQGISIMIFPEGTRSADHEIGPFKLGAFQLAIMTDKPILPVIVDGTGEVVPKHGIIFRSRKILKIKVLDPIHPGLFGTGVPEELAAKFRTLMVNALKEMRAESNQNGI
jgi:1-acyl-sn-glycerol-3-phosphate acyltransferase